MSGGKMGCIPKIILYGGVGIAVIALIAYGVDQVSPGTGSALWEGLGELALGLLRKIGEAIS